MNKLVDVARSFLCLLLGNLILGSCTTYHLTKDLPDTLALEQEIQQCGTVTKKPGVPIIDIHTHFFNSRYLPIQGVIVSREDELLTFQNKAVAFLGTGHWLKSEELRQFGQLIQLGTSTDPVKRRHLVPNPESVNRLAKEIVKKKLRYQPWLWVRSEASLVAAERQELLRKRLMKAWWIKVPAKGNAAEVSEAGKLAKDMEAAGLIGDPTPAIKKAMQTGNYIPDESIRDESLGRVEELQTMVIDLTDGFPGARNEATTDDVDHKVITQRGLDRLLNNVEALSGVIDHPDPASLSRTKQSYEHQLTTIETVYWFALHLMAGEPELVRAYMKHENNRVDLFVHMMMNMAPSFRMQSVPEPHLYDFATDQLSRVRAVDKAADGRAMHFVAWNPFESKDDMDWNGANPKALQVIKKGLSMGAKGVKFYPPMGYRPADNAKFPFPKPPPPTRTPLVLEQWKSRYEAEGWTPKALDILNEKLFSYCAQNDIPIFVHSNHGDMRADGGDDPNYGELAHPRYWEAVLQKHHNLRLCLGHAGGGEYWIGITKKPFGKPLEDFTSWGSTAQKLCLKYPNVFCEVGIHYQVANPALAARYVARMQELAELKCDDGRHTFADKIMYGSDWFMPITEPAGTYLDAFLRIYQTKELARYYDRFFSKNAMAYLKLPPGSVRVHEEARRK